MASKKCIGVLSTSVIVLACPMTRSMFKVGGLEGSKYFISVETLDKNEHIMSIARSRATPHFRHLEKFLKHALTSTSPGTSRIFQLLMREIHHQLARQDCKGQLQVSISPSHKNEIRHVIALSTLQGNIFKASGLEGSKCFISLEKLDKNEPTMSTARSRGNTSFSSSGEVSQA
ncbi:hypothetical protein RND71_004117 [Anisodus tanguticus]|uniref:Uncharacterized protein n=1 Tax=Anisodus tanguticus TaxID=243964 RepID=A0AAE1SY05_9SOLA|nr:hypothetical protein RND71_004117 [Anisodus tanguticus]